MPECSKTVEVSVESKVLAALAYFATGKYQKTIGGKSDPAISSYFVSASVMQVTQALNHPTIVKKYIHFPHLREERDVIKARFYMKYGMPNVIGCIDCTHVPIPKPEEDLKSHFNKSYHSKKVQIICDSDLTILSVDPSPGSHSHDGILQRHAVRVDLEPQPESGAVSSHWCVTTVIQPRTVLSFRRPVLLTKTVPHDTDTEDHQEVRHHAREVLQQCSLPHTTPS
ncbi:DDE superfamily endonuclease domain-containing protein [Phthorimaea operculella]|nr:DDE superfamily endonuclease domain-containing protein [Phthorimaea operculella]